jgi:prolyl-tRNA synthetase
LITELLKKTGFKFAEWELKGVPVRIAVGPRFRKWNF